MAYEVTDEILDVYKRQTKRYRSNCVNWGMLPFTCPEKEICLEAGEYIYLPGIRRAVEERREKICVSVIGKMCIRDRNFIKVWR